MKNPKAILPLLVLLSFVFASPVFSQSHSADTHISGTLTDPSGAGVAGARITAQHEGSTEVQAADSSSDGSYSLALSSGRYHIVVTKDSFATRETDITLPAGETLALNFRMQLAPMSSSVLVTGLSAPSPQEQSPAPSSILTSEQIDQQQAITLVDLINTQPGISIARTGPIGGLTTLFLDGGNSNYTKVFIDGTPANEPGGNFNYSSLTLTTSTRSKSFTVPKAPSTARMPCPA